MGNDIELIGAAKAGDSGLADTSLGEHLAFVPDLPTTKQHRNVQAAGTSRAPEFIDRSQDVGPAPDGGWRAYSVCFGAFLCNFCIFGFSESMSGGLSIADDRHCVWAAQGILSQSSASEKYRV